MQPQDSEEIASLKIDQHLQYLHDFERPANDPTWIFLLEAQLRDFNHDTFNYKYTLPEPKEFQSFASNIYNNYQNIESNNDAIESDWRLLYRVQGTVCLELFDGFFAELYLNAENRFLLLVIKGTSSIGNLWSDIKNVGLGLKGGELNSAFTFGEKVRVLMNKFKCKPMLLITGHSLGGYLAQIITYTITYCFVDCGKVKSRKEPMDDFGIYTVVFDSPAALKQISSIDPKDPIQHERFRLPIVNFIVDVNIINSNSNVGPHLGQVISVKEFEDLKAPNKWQRIKLLTSHKIKNFEEIDRTQCRQVDYLPHRKTVKYEEKEIHNCFFSSKNFERLHKYLYFSAMWADLVNRLPKFKISNSCIFLEDEKVSAEEFIPKAHLFLSQFKEKLDNGTFDGKNLIDNAIYELWKAEKMEHAHNFCLNEQWKGIVQALRDGTKIGGFKSFEEMRFAGCLIHNSFQRCIYYDYDQFIAMNPKVLDNLTSTTEAMLILIVRENKQNIIYRGGEKLKILYLVLDEDTEVKLTFKLTALEEKSANYLKNTKLDLFGNKVSAMEIFGMELLEKLTIFEICNFQKHAVPTPNHSYSDQKISGRGLLFKSAVAFARELLKKEKQFVLISSDAGMGKTTALRQIALTLQRKFQNNWIVLMNLFDIQYELLQAKDSLTSKEAAVEFVRNLELADRKSDEVLTKVFNWKLQEKKMVFLFDSLDEVCPFHRETVEKFIELLRETQLQIVLTTRPHEGKNFQNADLFKLELLDRRQRRNYIYKKFKLLHKKPPSDPEEWLAKICDKNEFWRLPLNLNMATSMYDADAEIAEPSVLISNKNIYELFLTKSVEDTLKFKFNLEKNHHQAASIQIYKKNVEKFNEIFEVLAFCLIFHGGEINSLTKKLQKNIKMDRESINRFDVVKLDNEYKSVSFLHRSYAEYLVAKVFLKCHKKDFVCHALKLNKTQLKRIYLNDDFFEVRKHVCKILAASPSVTMDFVPDFINNNENKLLVTLINEDCYEMYLQLKKHNFTFRLEIINGIHGLYLALEKAREEFVRQLIEEGAKFEDILNEKGVLHLAIRKGFHQQVKDHFESLKGDIHVERFWQLPLAIAAQHASRDLVRFLIENGADVDAKDKISGTTALLSAIFANNADVCELLIAKGANCTEALSQAAIFGTKDLFDVIYKSTPSECREERVREAHFEAAFHGKLDMFKHICGLPEANPLALNSYGNTFLHCAAEEGHLHWMPSILEYMNHSVDARNKYEETALMRALMSGHDGVVQWLLGQGADIHAVNSIDRTSCLFYAALSGKINLVEMCLDAGIDINSQDNDGQTALFSAYEECTYHVLEFLLEKGANPKITDNEGSTCLHAACENNSPQCMMLLVKILPLNYANHFGQTPLHWAALNGREENVAFLLEEAKNRNIEPVNSETIIRLTKRIGDFEMDSKSHEDVEDEILEWRYIVKDV